MYQYFVVTISLAIISSIAFVYFLEKKSMSKKHKIIAVILCTVSVTVLSSMFPLITGGLLNFTMKINNAVSIRFGSGISYFIIFIIYLISILSVSIYLSTFLIVDEEKEDRQWNIKLASVLSNLHKLLPWRSRGAFEAKIGNAAVLEGNAVSNYHAADLQGAVAIGENILQKPVDSEKNIDTIGIGASGDIKQDKSFSLVKELPINQVSGKEVIADDQHNVSDAISNENIETDVHTEEPCASGENVQGADEVDGIAEADGQENEVIRSNDNIAVDQGDISEIIAELKNHENEEDNIEDESIIDDKEICESIDEINKNEIEDNENFYINGVNTITDAIRIDQQEVAEQQESIGNTSDSELQEVEEVAEVEDIEAEQQESIGNTSDSELQEIEEVEEVEDIEAEQQESVENTSDSELQEIEEVEE
ncbi:MAG: hypothetical protein Q8942_06660, partial [Bacillota bacterium]|nr:hypothetical protein [Bacillota bacterium]